MQKVYVVIAFIAPADVQVISVATTKDRAVYDWKKWMSHFDSELENDPWLVRNGISLLERGITDKQDSGCFYRLESKPLKTEYPCA